MSIKTYRARTMREAIDLIRADLGPEAAVLHTRELNRGLMGRLFRGRQIEVAASASVEVPSHFACAAAYSQAPAANVQLADNTQIAEPPPLDVDYRAKYREAVRLQFSPELDELHDRVKQIYSDGGGSSSSSVPDSCFHAFTDMIEAGIEESMCRSLLERARRGLNGDGPGNSDELKQRLVRLVAEELPSTGGIRVVPGKRRVVALVGPTGVGKTTTIAKLAANFRLRERRRVGLVTVDTYRVAAVEQLRTYADIIDLPMEVVSTPREMREAIARLSDLDLVLVDTAGRSPRDEVKIQELKSMLGETEPDEVHLVLSCAASAQSLATTAERFTPVGVTSLLYTKLDEATSLGHLLPSTQLSGLPISYLTDGQNVPDDIQACESMRLAQRIFEAPQ
jgi:flagellar biosynthesis protein FlhF